MNTELTENERNIGEKISNFNERIDKAYKKRYKTKSVKIRNFICTDNEVLFIFFFIYKNSIYYKNDNMHEEEINSKIFDYLQEIVFDMYLIFEFEIFDENKLYKENPKNEYERLYNLNKTLNLVIKTRIVWEKLMNFMYLAIEREDIEKKVSKSKSKKAIFKKWCEDNEYEFMNEPLQMLEKFDEKFRTAEVHKHSKLKSYFEKGVNNSINFYCLTLLFKLSNETILNLCALFCGKKGVYKSWRKMPFTLKENIDEFEKMPNWLIEYIKNNDLDENLETFSGWIKE